MAFTMSATDAASVAKEGGSNSEPRRFRLRRTDFSHGDNPYVDAGWWPSSRDLGLEAANLVREADRAGFHTRRITFSLDDGWQSPPRRVSVAGIEVKVGGYHQQRAGTLTLLDDNGRDRLEVLVVPPDTEQAAAEQALRVAGRDGDRTRSEDILVPAPDVALQAPQQASNAR